jgi:hypothetical protein
VAGEGRVKEEEQAEMDQIRKFLEGVVADLEQEGVQLFVVEMSIPDDARAVFTLFEEYVRDPTLREISHGEFRMLAKVVRKLDDREGEAIDLLRGTALGGVSEDILGSMLEGLRDAAKEGMRLPDLITAVTAPALQVVPVAIYV